MLPALQPQLEIITLEQYEVLPEDKRVEVFDGVAYDMASPSQIHQSISMQLSTVINNYILRKQGDCMIKVNIYDDLYINFSELADLLNI